MLSVVPVGYASKGGVADTTSFKQQVELPLFEPVTIGTAGTQKCNIRVENKYLGLVGNPHCTLVAHQGYVEITPAPGNAIMFGNERIEGNSANLVNGQEFTLALRNDHPDLPPIAFKIANGPGVLKVEPLRYKTATAHQRVPELRPSTAIAL